MQPALVRKRMLPLAGFVTLLLLAVLAASCGKTISSSKPYDVVYGDRNLNLTLLNPQWYAQSHNHVLPSEHLCDDKKPWQSACTSQSTWANLASGLNSTFACGSEDGHHNWAWVTYDGTAYWDMFDWLDNDYNIDLLRSDFAGSTLTNRGKLPMEFDSSNTINHFDTPSSGWWHKFHDAVDDGDAAAERMLDGKQVIAFGLLGLDAVHSSHSELHPVVAMAVHVKDDPNDDTWAFYAMQWGDEGWCSSKLEMFSTVWPISFLLPRPGATSVSIVSQDIRCKCKEESRQGLNLRTGKGAELWFAPKTQISQIILPGTGTPTPFIDADRYHGEIHLKWTVDPAKAGPARPPVPQRPPAEAEEDEADEAEIVGSELIAEMTPQQRAAFNKLSPPEKLSSEPATPDKTLVHLEVSAQGAPMATSVSPPINKPNQVEAPEYLKQKQLRVAALRTVYGPLPKPFTN